MTTPDAPAPLPPDGSEPAPDGLSDALLREALRALDESAGEAPSPDPASVAAHLAGPGDEGVIAALAGSPRAREALGDLVVVERDVERELGRGPAREAVGPSLRERLLAAFPARAPAPAPRPVLRLPLRRVAAAAAVLLVATGGFVAISSRVEAGPSLPVEGIDRLASSGAVVSQGASALAFGTRLEPGASERIAIRLPGGGRVVLGESDALRVARDAVGGAAALALEAGDAVVSASPGSPVLLLLPGGDRVELEAGAARVDASERGAAVALPEGARALFTPRSGGARALSGPAAVRLAGEGAPSGPVPDETLAAIRRDLEFFGGPLRSAARERVVSSRRFRILDAGAPGRARTSDAAGLPAIRLDLDPAPAAPGASVAWRPGTSPDSTRAEVLLRVRGPAEGERPATLRVEASFGGADDAERSEGSAGTEGAEAPIPAGAGDVPLRVPVSLPVPSSLAREAAGVDLVLTFRAAGAPVAVWFEGLAFPPAAASPPRPPTIPAAKAGPR